MPCLASRYACPDRVSLPDGVAAAQISGSRPPTLDRGRGGGSRSGNFRPRGQAMASDPLPYARPRPGTQPPVLYPDYASTQKRAPKRAPIRLEHTLSETTGPVFEGG